MNAAAFQVFDQLLRSPRAVAERARAGGDLRPLFVASLGAVVLGASVFGATLATPRGGLQVLYSGVKMPFVLVATLLLVAPAFYAIARGLDRSLSFSSMIGLALAAAGRAALVLLGLSPVAFLALDRGISYHAGILLATSCYCVAGLSSLGMVLRGVGSDARGLVIVSLFGAVVLFAGGQTAWMLRPFLGMPGESSVSFLRGRTGSLFDSLERSANSPFRASYEYR